MPLREFFQIFYTRFALCPWAERWHSLLFQNTILSFFAMTSHVPDFLYLHIGKHTFYNSNMNRISAGIRQLWALLSVRRSWLRFVFVWAATTAPTAASFGARYGRYMWIKCMQWRLAHLYWLNWFCTLAPWNTYGSGRWNGESSFGGGMLNQQKRQALLKSARPLSELKPS